MNSRFLEEAKQLEGRWEKSGLLKGINKKYDRSTTAVLLECERLHNETGNWDCCDECKEREKQNDRPEGTDQEVAGRQEEDEVR